MVGNIKRTRKDVRYLRTAPPYLAHLHKAKRLAVVKLGLDGDLLGELLSHPKMEVTWKRISRGIPDDKTSLIKWTQLWTGITGAIKWSKNPPVPSDEYDYFQSVAKKAKELATILERKSGIAALNLPVSSFCPSDVIQANVVHGWCVLQDMWPNMAEVLIELSKTASDKAKVAKQGDRLMKRISKGDNGSPTDRARETLFLRLLHIHIRDMGILKSKADGINMVLGQISAVVFSHPDAPRTSKEVCAAIHGS